MPYVTQDRRKDLLSLRDPPNTAGDLNFMITKFLDAYLLQRKLTYGAINEAIGVLECAKLELYRRIAVPYEDGKAKTNGDVYTPANISP